MEPNECKVCGSTEDLIYGPDPFDSEVLGDDTDVWLCGICYDLSSDEI